MMYKNSFKLIFSKFNLVWKLLVYFIICCFICGGLGYFVNTPILKSIGVTEILSQVPEIINNFIVSFDAPSFLVSVQGIMDSVIGIVVNNFANIWHYLLIIAIVVVIIPAFVNNFYLMSTCNVLHSYMGSNVNFGFTASIFMNFWKNVRYNLAYLITLLPCKLLTYYLVVKSFALLVSEILLIKILSPFIIVSLYVILTAIRTTLFSGWVPYMVVKNSGVWSGFVNGFRSIRKRLPQIFANSIGVVLTILLISIMGLFTFGVSLVITGPAAFLFIATFNMVVFYTSTGLRFYVDNNNVFAPKKAEMVESYKIYKYLV